MSFNLTKAAEWSTILGVAGGFFTGCFYAVRWIIMWMWRVDRVVTNHIPHVEKMLRQICKHLNIDYNEPEGD